MRYEQHETDFLLFFERQAVQQGSYCRGKIANLVASDGGQPDAEFGREDARDLF